MWDHERDADVHLHVVACAAETGKAGNGGSQSNTQYLDQRPIGSPVPLRRQEVVHRQVDRPQDASEHIDQLNANGLLVQEVCGQRGCEVGWLSMSPPRICVGTLWVSIGPCGTADSGRPKNGRYDNGRSSIQSTYRRRSEKSHAPSIFTNVSR